MGRGAGSLMAVWSQPVVAGPSLPPSGIGGGFFLFTCELQPSWTAADYI